MRLATPHALQDAVNDLFTREGNQLVAPCVHFLRSLGEHNVGLLSDDNGRVGADVAASFRRPELSDALFDSATDCFHTGVGDLIANGLQVRVAAQRHDEVEQYHSVHPRGDQDLLHPSQRQSRGQSQRMEHESAGLASWTADAVQGLTEAILGIVTVAPFSPAEGVAMDQFCRIAGLRCGTGNTVGRKWAALREFPGPQSTRPDATRSFPLTSTSDFPTLQPLQAP